MTASHPLQEYNPGNKRALSNVPRNLLSCYGAGLQACVDTFTAEASFKQGDARQCMDANLEYQRSLALASLQWVKRKCMGKHSKRSGIDTRLPEQCQGPGVRINDAVEFHARPQM